MATDGNRKLSFYGRELPERVMTGGGSAAPSGAVRIFYWRRGISALRSVISNTTTLTKP